jgi:antirestriction protein ArdC
MPPKEAFAEPSKFYATNFHELGHNAASRIMPHGRADTLSAATQRRGRSA